MENLSNKDLSNLPVHKPDLDLWDRIDTELDLQGVSNNLNQLPQYSPKISLWKSINLKLTYYQYINYFIFAGIGISVTILFFVFINNSNTFNKEIKSIGEKEILLLDQPTSNNDYKTLSTSSENKENKKSINTIYEKNENPISLPEKTIALKNLKITKVNNKKNADQTTILKNPNPLVKKSIATTQNNLPYNETKNKTQKEMSSNDLKVAVEIVKHKPTENESIIKNQESNKAESNLKPENKTNIENTTKIQNPINESNGVEPKRVNLKSSQKPDRKGYSSVGIDFTYLKIYNRESFSYIDNQFINQYGINYQYNYSNWILQTGMSFSKFSDNLVSKVQFQKDQYNTFNYVDSVIYNSQGEIIQYVTHPVTINDSVIYQEIINVSKKYSFLNIPILAGYQWNYGKFRLSLKSGFLCTIIISEKDEMILPVSQYIKVLEIEPSKTSINGIKWAAVVSAGFSYDITKRWGLSTEPILYYHFKPFYDNMDINSGYGNKSPWLFGIKTGLFYKF